jgi:predicted alpha/beta-hydrolase family hydrolase
MPMLFLQGARDRMGPPDLIGSIATAAPNALMEVVAAADHGFGVPKSTGMAQDDVLDGLAQVTLAFLRDNGL